VLVEAQLDELGTGGIRALAGERDQAREGDRVGRRLDRLVELPEGDLTLGDLTLRAGVHDGRPSRAAGWAGLLCMLSRPPEENVGSPGSRPRARRETRPCPKGLGELVETPSAPSWYASGGSV